MSRSLGAKDGDEAGEPLINYASQGDAELLVAEDSNRDSAPDALRQREAGSGLFIRAIRSRMTFIYITLLTMVIQPIFELAGVSASAQVTLTVNYFLVFIYFSALLYLGEVA